MERNNFTEFLRMVLIAFAIAFVINLIRVIVFQDFSILNQDNHSENANYPVNNTPNEYQTRRIENSPELNTDFDRAIIQIPMTPEKALSGLTKEEILNIRREEMRTSPVFSNMNYTPNPSVYQIDDGLPWISTYGQLHWSTATDREKIEGVSRDSLGIINPELLYFIQVIDYYKKDENDAAFLYKTFNFLPYRVTYNPDSRTIIAYITNEKNENTTKRQYLPITIADSNAHDLGYKYAYMDSYENIGFFKDEPYSKNTLKSGIREITGYFMHGSACGISGGCNNYAPYWQYYNHFYIRRLPASFNIKLWKNKPSSPEDEADINFKMVFQ